MLITGAISDIVSLASVGIVRKLSRQINDGAGVKNILINSLINLEDTSRGIRSGVNLDGAGNSAIGMRVRRGSGLNLVDITGITV